MIRYRTLALTLLAFFLCGFLLAEAFGLPWLTGEPPLSGQLPLIAAATGVLLLTVDAALPVPSSVVMLALGGLYGIAWGVVLSVVGRTAGTLAGFACGRWFGQKLVNPDAAGAQLLRRWGAFAIVLTRPVPLIAETISVLAGASTMTWRLACVASFAGAIPEALLYSWVGAGMAA